MNLPTLALQNLELLPTLALQNLELKKIFLWDIWLRRYLPKFMQVVTCLLCGFTPLRKHTAMGESVNCEFMDLFA